VSSPEPIDGHNHLVAACAAGDRQALGRLFEIYSSQVLATACLITRDRVGADDVTQEVFLRLLSRIGQFRGDARFSSWLHRIVTNAAVEAKRTGRRFDALESHASVLVADASQHDACERAERQAQVRSALRTLTPRLRAPLILRYVRGMSYDEIGRALKISPGTVASRLSRGHAKLARALCRAGLAALVALVVAWCGWRATGPRIAFVESGDREVVSTLERTARALHGRDTADRSLDLHSDSPEAIRAFLRQRRAPFANLATRRPAGERDAYRPVGVAVLTAGAAPATAVYYRVNDTPVTVVTTRTRDLDVAPERDWMRLRVTHRVEKGVHSYSWTQSGQSYALVTRLPARQACRICHVDSRYLEAFERDTPP
jgi:RNA polymerase sigma-70 factor (ECF subfamily)